MDSAPSSRSLHWVELTGQRLHGRASFRLRDSQKNQSLGLLISPELLEAGVLVMWKKMRVQEGLGPLFRPASLRIFSVDS